MERRKFVKGLGTLIAIGSLPIVLPTIGGHFRYKVGDTIWYGCPTPHLPQVGMIWFSAVVLVDECEHGNVLIGSLIPEFDNWPVRSRHVKELKFRGYATPGTSSLARTYHVFRQRYLKTYVEPLVSNRLVMLE